MQIVTIVVTSETYGKLKSPVLVCFQFHNVLGCQTWAQTGKSK